ncbi:MAG: hypothetical protein ACKVX7_15065 [Planctomycetota bacterium]
MNFARPTKLLVLGALALSSTSLNPAAARQAGGQAGYDTRWSDHRDAKDRAKLNIVGILYYFPAKGSTDEPIVFKTKQLAEQSMNSPFILVTAKVDPDSELRKRYEVPEKFPTVVVTDWYGNRIDLFARQRLEDKAAHLNILKCVKTADAWAASVQKELAKKTTAVEKSIKSESWSAAIKKCREVIEFSGYPESEKCVELLKDINGVARKGIEKAEKLRASDKEGALKILRDVAKQFQGSDAATEAEKLIEELSKKN